jgi:tRNA G37 N-methylase Trm5/tRNA(Phe) wybutosine-synthesizing methylase Tyw3
VTTIRRALVQVEYFLHYSLLSGTNILSTLIGRISIFLNQNQTKGIHWLLVKHSLIHNAEFGKMIQENLSLLNESTIITMKCEPMIVHLECRSIEAAQSLHTLVLDSGYRESGITLGQKRVMLAIRTTAFSMEVPLVVGSSILHYDKAVDLIIQEANKRLQHNFVRMDRLLGRLREAWSWPRFRYLRVISSQYHIERWAHSSTLWNDSIAITGGYGLEDTSSSKSSRHLKSMAIDHHSLRKTETDNIEGMHGASVPFTANGCKCIIISGGRSSPSKPFSSIVTIVSHDFQKKLPYVESGSIPSPRWGHSLSALDEHGLYILVGGRDESSVMSNCFLLRVSLDETSSADGQILRCQWEQLPLTIEPLFFHAACVLPFYYEYEEMESAVIIHGGMHSLSAYSSNNAAYVIYPLRNTIYSLTDRDQLPKRFGHTLTYLSHRTLMITGGGSFEEDTVFPIGKSYLVDINFDMETARCVVANLREMSSFMIDGEELPCGKCRCHHQCLYNDSDQRLYMLGGGAMCLGFGPHYCASAVLAVSMGFIKQASADMPVMDSDQDKLVPSGSFHDVAVSNCLLVEKALAKTVKTFLEQKSFFDKSRRISPAVLSPTSSSAGDSSSLIHVIDLADLTVRVGYDDVHRINWDHILAVPIVTTFANELLEGSWSSKVGEVMANLASIIFSNKTADEMPKSKRYLHLQRNHVAPISKTIVANHSRQAAEYFDSIISRHRLPSSAKKSLPRKFECVGDVLMIPDDAFTDDAWTRLFSNPSTASSIWRDLCKIFNTTRVARKARIDLGPKRESHVALLYVPSSMSSSSKTSDTGAVNESAGWVEIVENGITFGFDITKVMFCSGNVTERMRMGRQVVKGEVIVDLYCGVGYYTLPFLVHGQAKLVIACEWNKNSIDALEYNLRRMHVSDRCRVYHDDNRRTIASNPDLHHIADRVCLGLLPSSTMGCPLAVKVLKLEGGIIHVHENIMETEIETWLKSCCESFQLLLQEDRGEAQGYRYRYNINCIHLERVKSYAPRVFHVVADLKIERIHDDDTS